jgi:hypothetical protein
MWRFLPAVVIVLLTLMSYMGLTDAAAAGRWRRALSVGGVGFHEVAVAPGGTVEVVYHTSAGAFGVRRKPRGAFDRPTSLGIDPTYRGELLGVAAPTLRSTVTLFDVAVNGSNCGESSMNIALCEDAQAAISRRGVAKARIQDFGVRNASSLTGNVLALNNGEALAAVSPIGPDPTPQAGFWRLFARNGTAFGPSIHLGPPSLNASGIGLARDGAGGAFAGCRGSGWHTARPKVA